MDQTSLKAYQNIKDSDKTISLRDRIMACMQELQYATKGMIAQELGLPEEMIHKRLSDLKNDGLILKTAYASLSKQTGKLQHVWVLPDTRAIILFL